MHAMETNPTVQLAIEMPPIGKVYYELNSLRQEVNYLNECMQRIHNQHDLDEHSYTQTESVEYSIPATTFHLNLKKKIDSKKLNLIESLVTLHKFSCKDTQEYSALKQLIHELFKSANELIQKHIDYLKSKKKDYAYMVDYTFFYSAYDKVRQNLENQINFWETTERYKIINAACNMFEYESTRRKIFHNIFGHEILTALSDSLIIKFQTDVAQTIFLDEIPENSKETIIKRLSMLYDTSNGRLLDAEKNITLLEKLLAHKAMEKKQDPQVCLLILEHCSLVWIQSHKSRFHKALENIKAEVTAPEIEQLMEPTGKPSVKLQSFLSRISHLYAQLNQTN